MSRSVRSSVGLRDFIRALWHGSSDASPILGVGGPGDVELRDSLAEIAVIINERDCASGEAPVGRGIVPVIFADEERVMIGVLVEPIDGVASCPSNPWHPITVHLGESLGDRMLFDGITIPPLLRTWPPSRASIDSFGTSG